MDKRRNIQLKLLSYGVIAYMILAFGWWSVLLYTKNEDAFNAKKELLIIAKLATGEIQDARQVETFSDYKAMEEAYQQQEWMITGEVLVFVIIMAIGLWLINNGYTKEFRAAEQRRNFLLSITHELKSPIASIRLVLDTIKKRKLKPEQQERILNTGLVETERLHQLVNNLLLSARLESAYQPNQEMVDLPALTVDLIDRIKAKQPAVNITLKAQADIPFLQGDRTGMTSVMLNLLENAIKYSPPPASIIVDFKYDKNHLIFTVADQGSGISDKEKKKIFEKFYRTGNEDTRRTKGTGLGLYIVKQIVLAHNGSIKVLDNSPHGSVFKISLPSDKKVLTDEQQYETSSVNL